MRPKGGGGEWFVTDKPPIDSAVLFKATSDELDAIGEKAPEIGPDTKITRSDLDVTEAITELSIRLSEIDEKLVLVPAGGAFSQENSTLSDLKPIGLLVGTQNNDWRYGKEREIRKANGETVTLEVVDGTIDYHRTLFIRLLLDRDASNLGQYLSYDIPRSEPAQFNPTEITARNYYGEILASVPMTEEQELMVLTTIQHLGGLAMGNTDSSEASPVLS